MNLASIPTRHALCINRAARFWSSRMQKDYDRDCRFQTAEDIQLVKGVALTRLEI